MQTIQAIEFHRALTEELPCGVYFLDTQLRITYWNSGAELISGYSSDQALNVRNADCPLDFANERGESLSAGVCPFEGALQDGQVHIAHVYMHHRNGHRVPVELRVLPIHDEHRNVIGAVTVFTDEPFMTEASRKIRALEKHSLEDPLTGLGNREFLQRIICARTEEMKHLNAPFGVILVCVDGLATVNERFGRNVGDQVLDMVGRTLSRNCRHYDIVGRWGGDELMLVVRVRQSEEIRLAGDRLRSLVAASYLNVDTQHVSAMVSMGGAVAVEGTDPEALVIEAGRLLAQSKSEGGNRISV